MPRCRAPCRRCSHRPVRRPARAPEATLSLRTVRRRRRRRIHFDLISAGAREVTVDRTELENLCRAIAEGPAVLFLGQTTLQEYAGEDLFLSTCTARFNIEGTPTLE